MSILKPKTADKTRTFSVRIPSDLAAQIEAIRADAERAGFVFDAAEIVGKALANASRAARIELDALCIQIAGAQEASKPLGLAQSVRDPSQREATGASDRPDAGTLNDDAA